MALSLTDNFLPSKTFAFNLDTTRPGFTFEPEDTFKIPDFSSLEKAQEKMYQGAVLKTVGSAIEAFDAILNFDNRHEIINTQADNTKIAADNQMAAIDNQVLYTKNQIMDRFTKMVATNTVQMAAKNLRVTAGSLLEGTKAEAYDINQDFAMLDSNVRLKKAELENVKEQAEIARSLAKTQQWTSMVQSLAKLGLNIATGGGTNESFGNLYSGYKAAKAWGTQSLNELY